MLRTLGAGSEDSVVQNNQQNQSFYLNDLTPMFLHDNNNQNQQNHLNQDQVRCKQLIQSLCDNQIKTQQQIDQINTLISENESLDKGIGYFGAKNMLMLEYMILLKMYELYKINGKLLSQGNGLQLYKRLAYIKTLLLKLEPVEKKLEYQKNKILKHAQKNVVMKENKKSQSEEEEEQQEISGEEQDDEVHEKIQQQQQQVEVEEDEMNFKPRPAALMNIKKQKEIKMQRNDKYEAPKISSNLSKEDKLKQRFEKQKQRKKLSLIRRLQSDLYEGDRAEQKYLGDEINEKLRRKFQQKVSYEQDAMIRLPDTKKDKFFKKQMIRNEIKKNQLEEDFKEVQMVRKLFDEENEMGKKLTYQKGNNKKTHQIKKNDKNNNNNKKNFGKEKKNIRR